MRSYELIYIVHPEVDEAGLAAVNETVTGLVERDGGKVVRVDPWGLRRLAYPIQKIWEGQYVLMHLELNPQGVTELERGLGLAEQVLRHLLVRLEEADSAGVVAKPVATVEEAKPVATVEEAETTVPEDKGTAAEKPEAEEAKVEEAEAEQAEPTEEPSEPAAD